MAANGASTVREYARRARILDWKVGRHGCSVKNRDGASPPFGYDAWSVCPQGVVSLPPGQVFTMSLR
jgi:hypothetical protein